MKLQVVVREAEEGGVLRLRFPLFPAARSKETPLTSF